MTDSVTETETDPVITGTHIEIHTPGERGTKGKLENLKATDTKIETMVEIVIETMVGEETTDIMTDQEDQGAEALKEIVMERETDTEIQGVGNQSH